MTSEFFYNALSWLFSLSITVAVVVLFCFVFCVFLCVFFLNVLSYRFSSIRESPYGQDETRHWLLVSESRARHELYTAVLWKRDNAERYWGLWWLKVFQRDRRKQLKTRVFFLRLIAEKSWTSTATHNTNLYYHLHFCADSNIGSELGYTIVKGLKVSLEFKVKPGDTIHNCDIMFQTQWSVLLKSVAQIINHY